MAKILLVDDDQALVETLCEQLKANGYICEACFNGEDALQLLGNFHHDLIVLDWSLPGLSGKEVCQKFRKNGGQAPIIFLTGQGDIEFKEAGLDAGADDYLVKPFEVRELLARAKTLLKRRPLTNLEKLTVDGMTLNVAAMTISLSTKVVSLRPKEVSLLEYLMKNANKVYSAQQLLTGVWPSDSEATTGSVRVWIKYLREKLAEVGRPDLIETVGKSGYTIRC